MSLSDKRHGAEHGHRTPSGKDTDKRTAQFPHSREIDLQGSAEGSSGPDPFYFRSCPLFLFPEIDPGNALGADVSTDETSYQYRRLKEQCPDCRHPGTILFPDPAAFADTYLPLVAETFLYK
jgi:hypothetical protein